jgi:DNA-binding MarR family transcriptional regulator
LSEDGAENANIQAALERLARLMRAGEHGSGLNPAQWEALRYLSRANRFSNSPIGLTRYLGSTKGTVSQTIKALERKGHILKAAREGEKRSIALRLTDKGLSELLAAELARTKQPGFGVCARCRHFRELGRERDAFGPHDCRLFDAALSEADALLICSEQV